MQCLRAAKPQNHLYLSGKHFFSVTQKILVTHVQPLSLGFLVGSVGVERAYRLEKALPAGTAEGSVELLPLVFIRYPVAQTRS